MLAAGQRNGAVIIVAVILLVLALLAVFMWLQASRREPLPHAAPPARTQATRPHGLCASVIDPQRSPVCDLQLSRFS